MTWTPATPTEPGVYLWRCLKDREDIHRYRLLRMGRKPGDVLRVVDAQSVAMDGRYLVTKTAAGLRGEWYGPIGEGE